MLPLVFLVMCRMVVQSECIVQMQGDDLDSNRIVAGNPAGTDWEFMAVAQLFDDAICSSLILSVNWTVSSCSCVQLLRTYRYGVEIVAGTKNVRSSQGQRRKIENIVTHPLCVNGPVHGYIAGLSFDYGLIQVDRGFEFDYSLRPMELPTWDRREFEGLIYDQIKGESVCVTAGWGETIIEYPGRYTAGSPVLLSTQVQLMNLEECSASTCRMTYDTSYCHSAVFMTGKVCAKSLEGGNPCKSDIGGPLICNGYLIAIVSEINTCGEYSLPNFFARLDVALPFIEPYLLSLASNSFRVRPWIILTTFLGNRLTSKMSA